MLVRRFKNKVWDTVAGDFVEWVPVGMTEPDVDGDYYPGPGDFGTDTSNYTASELAREDGTSSLTREAYDWEAFNEKTVLSDDDVLLLEDSEDSWTKKKVPIANLPGGSGTDADAVHVNVSSEISGIPEKSALVAADLFIIEDSEASNAKKSAQLGSIPHQSLSGAGTNDHSDIDDHISSTSNPHDVTKSQVGLSYVTDAAQLTRGADDWAVFDEKTTLVDDDLFLLEDSEDSGAKKKVKKSSIGGGSGTDPDAIHVNVSGEIAGLDEKTTPVDDDWLVLEDSEDGDAKVKLKIGNLPGGSGGLTADEVRQVVMSTCGGI